MLRDTGEPGILGIDFGTSNSAVAWRCGSGPARLLALEGKATNLPTALFYNAEEPGVHFGREAVALYLAGTEGRLLRSLKSLLGSALLMEKTALNGELVSFQEIITVFLAELRRRSAGLLGFAPREAVIGRPVHFVDDDAARDALAERTLREAAERAGFVKVRFQLEPVAAALDYAQRIPKDSVVLIVDIGGGTSDFSVVRLRAGDGLASEVLATSGVHVGGTDFDRKLNLENVMPLMGLRHIGPQGREVPSAVFHDLATWHLIHWRYTPQALREAQALRTDYADVRLHARLMRVLQQRHGHRIAHAVEAAKIASSERGEAAKIALDEIEAGLATQISPAAARAQLAALLDSVVACAQECIHRAGRDAQGVDALYLTGGSSALAPLQQVLARAFAGTPMVQGDLFGGVATGLACGGPPVG